MIFAEGKRTEQGYFNNWFRIYRDRVIVKVARHDQTTPLELVRRAIAQRSQDIKEARRAHGDAYDEYWCAFDVDRHPNLPEALELAKTEDIKIALSNPCIELWFVLHCRLYAAYLTTDEAERLAADLLGCGKVLSTAALELLVANYATARGHAHQLDDKHAGDGSPPRSNPSSNVWALVDQICGSTG